MSTTGLENKTSRRRTSPSWVSSDLQREKHRRGANAAAKSWVSTLLLLLVACYFVIPLYWLIISTTKNTNQLFNTPMLLPPAHINLWTNLKQLSSYQGGIFWRWCINSVIYAGVCSIGGTMICAMGGYALSKYEFKMAKPILSGTVGAIMIPPAATVVPIFLLLHAVHLLNSYVGLMLPLLLSPFGVYFLSVYIREAMPGELIEAARVDGASEYASFFRVALPIIRPGLVTLFLITFIGTWNNFFLPLVLLENSKLFPLTVGIFIWVSNLGQPQTAGAGLYSLIILGSVVSILPLLITFPFLRRYITAGITSGSLKI